MDNSLFTEKINQFSFFPDWEFFKEPLNIRLISTQWCLARKYLKSRQEILKIVFHSLHPAAFVLQVTSRSTGFSRPPSAFLIHNGQHLMLYLMPQRCKSGGKETEKLILLTTPTQLQHRLMPATSGLLSAVLQTAPVDAASKSCLGLREWKGKVKCVCSGSSAFSLIEHTFSSAS